MDLSKPVMFLGLGNPEEKYRKTRHQAGYVCLDSICTGWHSDGHRTDADYDIYIGEISAGTPLYIVYPMTGMNLSGTGLPKLMERYGIEPDNLVVFCDDINLPPGTVRVKRSGHDGGHNGLKSVNEAVSGYTVCKVGVGAPKDRSKMLDWVIGEMSNDEWNTLCKNASMFADFRRMVYNAAGNVEILMSIYNKSV